MKQRNRPLGCFQATKFDHNGTHPFHNLRNLATDRVFAGTGSSEGILYKLFQFSKREIHRHGREEHTCCSRGC